jgi:CheY-like chemotaxis protein
MRCDKPFLIVARNLDVQDLYVHHMRSLRVPVIGVDTCEDAIWVCGLAPFGAVLFDIEYRDDWEALPLFRKALARDVPIVVLTGWLAVDRTYRNLARDLGCVGFVAKPATPALVEHALQRAAEGSRWNEYMDLLAADPGAAHPPD